VSLKREPSDFLNTKIDVLLKEWSDDPSPTIETTKAGLKANLQKAAR
jgi:hypothetical protein